MSLNHMEHHAGGQPEWSFCISYLVKDFLRYIGKVYIPVFILIEILAIP